MLCIVSSFLVTIMLVGRLVFLMALRSSTQCLLLRHKQGNAR